MQLQSHSRKSKRKNKQKINGQILMLNMFQFSNEESVAIGNMNEYYSNL